MDGNRLLGKLEEQGRHFETRLTRIESKVDALLAFKWRVMGAASIAAFLATVLVEIVRTGWVQR